MFRLVEKWRQRTAKKIRQSRREKNPWTSFISQNSIKLHFFYVVVVSLFAIRVVSIWWLLSLLSVDAMSHLQVKEKKRKEKVKSKWFHNNEQRKVNNFSWNFFFFILHSSPSSSSSFVGIAIFIIAFRHFYDSNIVKRQFHI